MSGRRLTTAEAKVEVAAAVRQIESLTSAEVVVAVRPHSGHYRHTDWLVGSLFAFVALLVFLFWPVDFSIDWMPLESLIAFGTGAALSANLPALRRMFTSRRLMQSNLQTSARAAFVDLNIARTSARTGMLVYVSLFEAGAEAVLDIGIDRVPLEPALGSALAALNAAVRKSEQLSSFVQALRALGPVLASTLPRRSDDINELPDEPPA